MTITYSLDVANTRFCGFTKLLGRWKGSIYKILWKELAVFAVGYSLLSVTYRCFLDENQKKSFENVVIYCEAFVDLIPLSFVLGFYVSLVVGRWWEQFDAIPWPDRLCYLIAAYVHGSDERSRTIRRTLGRYLILMQAFTFQSVSTAVKKRFPSTQHFVAAGFMTKEERTVWENVEAPYGKWWLPAQWFSALAMRARKEGRIKDSVLLNGIMEEFLKYRSACGTMFNYDWISVPLVYTQVVTLAVYSYSLALLVGRQYLDPQRESIDPKHRVDLYVPFFTLLQFFFYVGWLKVAEQIVNPYGEDDDDFELNWCLNRSCQVVYLIVDHFHAKHPKLKRDAFWDELNPHLPETKISAKNVNNPQLGSAFNMEVNPADSEYLPMDNLLEEDSEAHLYNSDSVKQYSGVRYRPSFLVNFLNSNFGQSDRKRSILKSESFRETQQGHANPAFSISSEKTTNRKGSSSANSRKSSVAKKQSPAQSRSSSITFIPNSISRHKHKSYDLQQSDNGTVAECEGNGTVASMATAIPPVVVNFEDSSCSGRNEMESEDKHHKPERDMPTILEEPTSRVVSAVSLDQAEAATNAASENSVSKPLDDVQTLVAEASKVLEELNKAVTAGRHKKDCELKGYESCCSLDNSDDDSSDDEVIERRRIAQKPDEKDSEDSVAVDMSTATSGGTAKE